MFKCPLIFFVCLIFYKICNTNPVVKAGESIVMQVQTMLLKSRNWRFTTLQCFLLISMICKKTWDQKETFTEVIIHTYNESLSKTDIVEKVLFVQWVVKNIICLIKTNQKRKESHLILNTDGLERPVYFFFFEQIYW